MGGSAERAPAGLAHALHPEGRGWGDSASGRILGQDERDARSSVFMGSPRSPLTDPRLDRQEQGIGGAAEDVVKLTSQRVCTAQQTR